MSRKLSFEIVIPIYNEEVELEQNVLRLYSYIKNHFKNWNFRITIADNASKDQSLEIANKLAHRFNKIGVLHLAQKGRGRAVKKAWKESKADILCYMDVDLSTDLKFLKNLITPLSDGYDIAIGSRLLLQSKVIGRPLKREILSRIYNIMIKVLFQVKFNDAQCGFKAVTKNVVKNLIPHLKDNAWFLDSELLIVGEKSGYKIKEIPVKWVDNPGSTVRVLKTVSGDLEGLWRLFLTRPWMNLQKK